MLSPELARRLVDLEDLLAADDKNLRLVSALDHARLESSTPIDGEIELSNAGPIMAAALRDADGNPITESFVEGDVETLEGKSAARSQRRTTVAKATSVKITMRGNDIDEVPRLF